MTNEDIDILCSALAFAAVAMRGDSLPADGAKHAASLAYLIKEFCRSSVPEAFADDEEIPTRGVGAGLAPEGKFAIAERMATVIAKIMRENVGCLPQDLIAHGFTPDEIDRHWAMAKALAHVELNMMDS